MRERLRSGGLYLFDSCTAAIETVQTLTHEPDNPEDMLKCPTDHAADALRYLCMARPWAGSTEAEHRQQQEEDRRRQFTRLKPGEEIYYEVQPDGSVRSNATMWDFIHRSQREKRMRGWR